MTKGWSKYWKGARVATDYREALLRYATFKSYRKQMTAPVGSNIVDVVTKAGTPKNFGASSREVIMALSSIDERAFKMSNDLLGAYDEISATGRWMRDYIYPFWSWKEVNMRRYAGIWKNQIHDERFVAATAQSFLKKIAPTKANALRGTYAAWRTGQFLLKANAMFIGMMALNLKNDDDKKLPPDVRANPHITAFPWMNKLAASMGVINKGEVMYFDRLGAFSDMWSIVGFDAPGALMSRMANGQITKKEVVEYILKSHVNWWVQGFNPIFKTGFDLSQGQRSFPDWFRTTTIRDKYEYVAEQFGLKSIYRKINDLPNKPMRTKIIKWLAYTTDTREASYYRVMSAKKDYHKLIGKTGGNVFLNDKSNKLYNIKLAVRYGQFDIAMKWAFEYYHAGGTKEGFRQSVRSFDPLYGMKGKELVDFYLYLSPEERNHLTDAKMFYQEVLLTSKGFENVVDKLVRTYGKKETFVKIGPNPVLGM